MKEARESGIEEVPSEGKDERTEKVITRDFEKWTKSTPEFKDSVNIERFEMRLDSKEAIDLCTFHWKNDVELECYGFECKRNISIANIYGYFEQLNRYHSSFPKLYVLTGSVRNESAINEVCKASGIGLYRVESASTTQLVSEAGIRIFDLQEYGKVRAIGAAHVSFDIEFPNATHKSWWASTTGTVQFNMYFHTPTNSCRLGVNIENMENANVYHHWKKVSRLVGKLPDDSLIRISRNIHRYPQRIELPVITASPDEFEGARIFKDLHRIKNEVWHLNISAPLWTPSELLTKPRHLSRLQRVKKMLESIFFGLGGSLSPY